MEELLAPLLEQLGPALTSFKETAEQGQAALQAANQGVQATTGALKNLGDKIVGLVVGIATIPAQIAGAVASMAAELAKIPETIIKILTDAAAQLVSVGTQFVSSFANVISTATDALLGPFQQLANAIGPFVTALNPTIMNVLGQAFRDLQAAIGVALLPVARGLISIFRQMNIVLLPLMRELQPIMRTLIAAIGNAFIGWLNYVVTLLRLLVPLFQFWADNLKIAADAIQVFYAVLSAVAQTIAGVFQSLFAGFSFKDVASKIRSAMEGLVKVILAGVANIARIFGAMNFLNSLIANLQWHLAVAREEGKRQRAAPTNAGTTNFEGLAREFATAAFVAQEGGGQQDKTQEQFLEELVNMLQVIAGEEKTKFEALIELLTSLLANVSALSTGVEAVTALVRALVQGPAHIAGKAAGGAGVRNAVSALLGR